MFYRLCQSLDQACPILDCVNSNVDDVGRWIRRLVLPAQVPGTLGYWLHCDVHARKSSALQNIVRFVAEVAQEYCHVAQTARHVQLLLASNSNAIEDADAMVEGMIGLVDRTFGTSFGDAPANRIVAQLLADYDTTVLVLQLFVLSAFGVGDCVRQLTECDSASVAPSATAMYGLVRANITACLSSPGATSKADCCMRHWAAALLLLANSSDSSRAHASLQALSKLCSSDASRAFEDFAALIGSQHALIRRLVELSIHGKDGVDHMALGILQRLCALSPVTIIPVLTQCLADQRDGDFDELSEPKLARGVVVEAFQAVLSTTTGQTRDNLVEAFHSCQIAAPLLIKLSRTGQSHETRNGAADVFDQVFTAASVRTFCQRSPSSASHMVAALASSHHSSHQLLALSILEDVFIDVAPNGTIKDKQLAFVCPWSK